MTSAELKAQIDSQITNETTANAITPTDVGTNLKAIVDYVDQEVLTSQEKIKDTIVGLLSYDGTDFTYTSIVNETAATISWSKFSGIITGTMSSAVLTAGKAIIKDQSIDSGGGYIVTGRQANTTIFTLTCTSTAGTNSSVPNFTDMPIEINIYL